MMTYGKATAKILRTIPCVGGLVGNRGAVAEQGSAVEMMLLVGERKTVDHALPGSIIH